MRFSAQAQKQAIFKMQLFPATLWTNYDVYLFQVQRTTLYRTDVFYYQFLHMHFRSKTSKNYPIEMTAVPAVSAVTRIS